MTLTEVSVGRIVLDKYENKWMEDNDAYLFSDLKFDLLYEGEEYSTWAVLAYYTSIQDFLEYLSFLSTYYANGQNKLWINFSNEDLADLDPLCSIPYLTIIDREESDLHAIFVNLSGLCFPNCIELYIHYLCYCERNHLDVEANFIKALDGAFQIYFSFPLLGDMWSFLSHLVSERDDPFQLLIDYR